MNLLAPIPSTVAIVVGAFLAALGSILLNVMPHVIKDALTKTLALNPDGDMIDFWRDLPMPVYRKFYFFNYTNVDEFLATWQTSGTKPHVDEIGPYTYRIYERKTEVAWLDGDLVQYRTALTFVFQPDLTAGTLSDMVITPNSPVTAIVSAAKDKGLLSETGSVFYMTEPTLFVEHSVSELLFDGYEDETVRVMSEVANEQLLPGNRFAFFAGVNNTPGPVLLVHRGNLDIEKLGLISKWNNTQELPYWRGHCNDVTGYVGPFPPFVPKGRLSLFAPDMCRGIHMNYKRDTVTLDVPTHRFAMDVDIFADYNYNPENECFCSPKNGTCHPTGVFSLAKCMMGAPVFMSLPHFLHADYRLLEAIDGLQPNVDKHQSYLELERITSVPIKAMKRAQSNLMFEPTKEIPLFADIPEILLPLFWIDEKVELPEDMLQMIKESIERLRMAELVPIGILAFGGFCGAVGVLCAIAVMFKKNHVLPLMAIGSKEIHVTSYVPAFTTALK